MANALSQKIFFKTSTIGCRSLDILHCAAAKIVGATDFVSTDVRQKALATAIGLKLIIV
jgi:hypothetical protein